MSDYGPVGRVLSILAGAGYEIVEQPRDIGGIPFEFAAMLARHDSLDLIVVIDLVIDGDDDGRVRRRIEGLARALDLVRSRRSLTIILLGPERGELIQALAGVARVLTVKLEIEGEDADVASSRTWRFCCR